MDADNFGLFARRNSNAKTNKRQTTAKFRLILFYLIDALQSDLMENITPAAAEVSYQMVSSNSAESSVDNSSFQVPNTQGLQEQVTARLCLYAVRCRKRRSFRGNRSTDRNIGCGIGVGLSWTILKIISVALDQAFRLSGQVLAIAGVFLWPLACCSASIRPIKRRRNIRSSPPHELILSLE